MYWLNIFILLRRPIAVGVRSDFSKNLGTCYRLVDRNSS